jgi:hypothetical protein
MRDFAFHPDRTPDHASADGPVSVVRLRALSGRPLADARLCAMVVSSAQALAERNALRIDRIETAPDAITLWIAADKLACMGFLMELRRNTNAWYEAKYEVGPLWGTPAGPEE